MNEYERRVVGELAGIREELKNQNVALCTLIQVLAKLLPQPCDTSTKKREVPANHQK